MIRVLATCGSVLRLGSDRVLAELPVTLTDVTCALPEPLQANAGIIPDRLLHFSQLTAHDYNRV
jgi:hypothetical protein